MIWRISKHWVCAGGKLHPYYIAAYGDYREDGMWGLAGFYAQEYARCDTLAEAKRYVKLRGGTVSEIVECDYYQVG
jgi:hypothetical protein